jgi:hypothetical protein
MDRFNALGRGAQIMLVAGVLLLIDTFFDWQAVDDFPGVSAWDNFLGIVMGLLTIALIVWLAVRVAGVDFRLPISNAMTSALLGGLILIFAVLKNLTDDFSTFWAYLGVLLAAAIAVGAWLEVQAAGGMDTLRSEIPTSSTPSTTSTTTTTTTTTVPPATSTPTPPESAAPEAAPPPVEPAPPTEPAEPTPPTEPERPYDPDERRES